MNTSPARAYIKRLFNHPVLDNMQQHITQCQERITHHRFKQRTDKNQIDQYWQTQPHTPTIHIADPNIIEHAHIYSNNIEQMIGHATIPVGLAGPLSIHGTHAQGAFPIPLATTEAALVASYHRGCVAINRAGGALVATTRSAILRTPAFIFDNIIDVLKTAEWVQTHTNIFHDIVRTHSQHGTLISIEPHIDNELLFLCCSYHTADASGQNMATILTQHIGNYIAQHAPITPKKWFIEANASGDKKTSQLANIHGRGRKISAQIVLNHSILRHILGTTTEDLLDYARVANIGAHLAGQQGIQGHFANGLAALYIATGQDPACVAEGATGTVRIDAHPDGVKFSATIPSIMVGTVGGGTNLPSASEWLTFMGMRGAGHADTFAEIAAGLCLAGEISISAAIASGHFTRAHQKLARERKDTR